MIYAFLGLIACQFLGEALHRLLHLPLPGPLIGMFLLTVGLVLRPAQQPRLAGTANALIGHMGLLFVPAGVGVITEVGVLQQAWLPILAGLIVSTVLGLVVTGLVMHHVTRRVEGGLSIPEGGDVP